MDPAIVSFFANAGPVGAVAILFWLIWQKSDARYADLAKDFKTIVQENTAASTEQADATKRLCNLIETQLFGSNGNGPKRG